ncbi:hypothetical protein NEUTE1DRAFT_144835 [Neurospora tetrasperma FGSC 2508]|uniref:U6 small nuclear RNA (adenine-(43)-N(6))-methyltransferase n=1 Tax=Neurospora tetrasperma (strain FGSC 2508 / ATCC MYA-4615 / P0657) TaxID=510951 RepID=F8MGA4_NEUT8|nr:uncharacterized protein NEUTE1DRAFT_144835 [Neurospora tetrasperma FGSC 2508]EGO58579.1 hypothetical protein NEUTE1DRAFT_144835 [Neurospora tetrasperma FGSC 2508]EGZ72648.1 hypothetical protein NEUTE2DRAFT_156372 [Neurospora tetrasperma FGSC 2509]
METNKRKAAVEEGDEHNLAGEGELNSPFREPEAKRQKQTNNEDLQGQPAQEATKPTSESDRPHNIRSVPPSGSGPGQAIVATGRTPRKWTDEYFRNLYTKDPSFKYLGQKDPDFAPFLDSQNQLDFNDPAAVMQLTKTLLRIDYGLKIDLPPDRLCPPVPNRHNYILWLTSLLSSSSYHPHFSSSPDQKNIDSRPIIGLDIGTGASAIYPLLGCVQHPHWSFIATDIDAHSLSFAQRNIHLNKLQDRITLLHRTPDQPLIPFDSPILTTRGIDKIDFTMCNPPFYSSPSDLLSSAAKKSRPPLTACTGAPVEMVCAGGEVAHIFRMIDESLVLREKVTWYTSMIGKVTSLETVVERLRKEKIQNYAVTELVQGKQTKRWVVGWSFGGMRAGEVEGRGVSGVWKKLLPPVVSMEVGMWKDSREKVGMVVERVKQTVEGLELMSWEWSGERMRGVGRARANVWSRAWRRKREREMKAAEEGKKNEDSDGNGTKEEEKCKLGFEVVIEVGKGGESKVLLLWREGHDQGLFESLWGYFQGKLKDI